MMPELRWRVADFCWLAVVFIGLGWVDASRSGGQAATPAGEERERFFEERVRPLLARRCFECHGPDQQEGGLRLDSREAVFKGGDRGQPAAVAGDLDQSLLLRAIRHEGDLQMPPDFKLPDEEVAIVRTWIELGLPWGGSGAEPRSLADRVVHDRQAHWSLRPIRRPAFPPVVDRDWISTGIDYFVLAKLESEGLTPSAAADRRTLIRRLSFDLHGLPPSVDEVESFVLDRAPDAYERLVDRLLASPRYGERWGRHWLDLARYADTRGYAFGQERRYPYAYTYRDYVIAALNSDKPYDRFVLEQLAADQLPLGDDKSALAAMGFLTTGRRFNNRQDDLDDQIDVVCRGLLGLTVACARCHDHKYDAVPTEDYYALFGVFASSREPSELPLIGDPTEIAGFAEFQRGLDEHRGELERFRAEKRAEVVQAARERVTEYLARVLVATKDEGSGKPAGISLGKDELRPRLVERWRDYLQRQARPDDPLFGVWSEIAGMSDSQFAAQAADLVARWREMTAGLQPGEIHPALKAKLASQPPASRQAISQIYGQLLKDAHAEFVAAGGTDESFKRLAPELQLLAQVIAGKESPTSIAVEEVSGYLSRADRNRERELQKKIETYQVSSPAAPPRAMVLYDNDRPQDAPVLIRGNPGRPGKTVSRQFLLLLSGANRQPFSRGSGRLELAQQIVDPGNPLTRRVMANRVWMHHMGQPLVRTPSDFGVRSDPPLHPELLDYMASLLANASWSLKALHREIVLSSTYRQISLGPSAPNRSSPASGASAIRAVDPENRLYGRMNQRRLEFEPLRDSLLAVAGQLDLAAGGRAVDLIAKPFSRRRTIYGMIDRQDLPNLLRVFDFASPDQSQAERPRTTVPQQALFFMNSPFVQEQAQALASRPEVAGATEASGKIDALYRLAFQRPPSEAERQVAERFVATVQQDANSGTQPDAWTQYAQLLLMTNEFCYVD